MKLLTTLRTQVEESESDEVADTGGRSECCQCVANVEDTGGTFSCTCPQPILSIKFTISYICIIVHGESISSSQLPCMFR